MPMRLEHVVQENGNSNGHSSILKNGTANGATSNLLNNSAHEADYFGSSKLEATRLIIQALHELEYPTAAAALEAESMCSIESADVAAFRTAVLNGRWAESERLLMEFELKAGTDVVTLKFLIRQQKFLELLEQRDLVSALGVLRGELSVLDYDTRQLHCLSSLMMCASAEDLRNQAGWTGVEGNSRSELLRELQKYISPAVMIPEHRLATLLDQAQQYEILKCTYHNFDGPVSLYTDHVCDRNQFPSITSHVLTDHTGEVWFVAFSNDGTKLASASKDLSVIIWDVATFKSIRVFHGHTDAVTSLAWSPDDTTLITCGLDHTVKLWDVQECVCLLTVPFGQPVTSCAWMQSGDEFLTGCLDIEKPITLWSIHGTTIHQWTDFRVFDLALTPDSKKIVAVCQDDKIRIYNRSDYKLTAEIQLQAKMTSVSISKDSKYALVNISAKEVHLWDIDKIQLARKCVGQQQSEFIIRSCFGGMADNFIVSGSEDASIYVWKKDDASLIEVLSGHTKGVNSVAWNPKNKYMFASASDDNTIRIWTNSAS
ncbi:WD40-repeat-containing domain protein [Lipomyces chichibuensis]|uniref:WD40-repeat-containing domain protein n=1 Tax=Lipomyces chichibuensis TaxID=1546026 RepID=UPI0033430C92